MKNLLFLFAILICACASAQKKKPKRSNIPPPIIVREIETPPEPLRTPEDDRNRCYINKVEEKKGEIVYVTENLFEYGWNGDNARMVITESNYDPVKDAAAKKEGYTLVNSQKLQFIDGDFKIQKDILTFTPEKNEKFATQKFKIHYKAKTKKVDRLEAENRKIYKIGKCLEPTISM